MIPAGSGRNPARVFGSTLALQEEASNFPSYSADTSASPFDRAVKIAAGAITGGAALAAVIGAASAHPAKVAAEDHAVAGMGRRAPPRRAPPRFGPPRGYRIALPPFLRGGFRG